MKPSVAVAWALVVAMLLMMCVNCEKERHRISKRSGNANQKTGDAVCGFRFRCKKKKVRHVYSNPIAVSSVILLLKLQRVFRKT